MESMLCFRGNHHIPSWLERNTPHVRKCMCDHRIATVRTSAVVLLRPASISIKAKVKKSLCKYVFETCSQEWLIHRFTYEDDLAYLYLALCPRSRVILVTHIH